MTVPNPSRRDFIKTALAAAAATALPSWAQVQAYPSRPIRLICPWPAGSSTDLIMRSFADSVGSLLGGSMIVINKPGASGTLGAIELVNAKPDGYTLSQLPPGVFSLPHMQKAQYDPLKDFTYIICLTGYTIGLVVSADSPFNSVKDLVEFAKANPGVFSYATAGIGTTSHSVVEEIAQRAGIKLLHVPYHDANLMQALQGGHVMAISAASSWAPYVNSGQFRLLVTYGSKRTKRWPNVPTLQELGYGIVADSPYGIAGPKGMDPAITKRLHDAFKEALEEPAVLAMLNRFDQPVVYLDSAAYTKFAHDTFQAEKATIERLGLGFKGS